MQTNTHDKVFWHEAFTHALQLELWDYKDSLTFRDEYPLSKEALIVDVVVIKKAPGVKIEKNIGKILRGHNLVEFKSEKDSLSVSDYNKVMGYASLYASFTPADILDMTVTFSVTVHPRDLFAYLENKRKLGIKYDGSGIYHISGEAFPVQVIESKKLSRAENQFITMLRSSMDVKEADEAMGALRKAGVLDNRSPLFDRILRANWDVFKEVTKMSAEAKELIMGHAEAKELIMGHAESLGWLEEVKKNEARKVARETARETAREIARGFKQDNVPLHIIIKNTGLTAQEIESL